MLTVTQAEPSRGFVAWQALVDGYAPMSSNDPAVALQSILATPKRCKDAKELKEKLTAWSLKVAEYEQFKVIDEAQKTFVVREMMPKDIRREFLTGPRKFDEIMKKSEIIINEMMADDGPVPLDLGNVGMHDARMMQSDQDMNSDVSFDDMCAIAWKRKQSRQRSRQTGQGRGTREKELANGCISEETSGCKNGGKKGTTGSRSDWYGDKDKGGTGNKAKSPRQRRRLQLISHPTVVPLTESEGSITSAASSDTESVPGNQDFENQEAQHVEEVQLGRVLREALRSLDGVDVGHLFSMRAVLMKSPPAFVKGAYRRENVVTKLGVCVDGSCSCWSHECCSVHHEVD